MRKLLSCALLALAAALTACGALASGGELVLPAAEDVAAVTLTGSELDLVITDKVFTAQLLERLTAAKNTGRASVQDSPEEAAGLVRIDFAFRSGGTSTVFLYRETAGLLLEQPYQGIYQVDDSLESWLRLQIAQGIARRQMEG